MGNPRPVGEAQSDLGEALLSAAKAAGIAARAVERLSPLGGGASKEMWGFTLTDEDGSAHELVLRRQPAGRRFSSQGLPSVAAEAALVRLAGEAGVPVPEVVFELPPGSPAGDGYAMARIAGETLGNRVLRLPELAQARTGLARQCGEILARLHAVRGYKRLGLRRESAAGALAALELRYRDTRQARPVFELALRWLGQNLPVERGCVLLHGDFRTGNLVVGPEGIRAVLDWELSHLGPRACDLAWLCVPSWRFQRPDLPVGGFGSREDLLAGYEDSGGMPIDPDELFAWEVYQTLNWGVMCAGAGRAYMDGERSLEGAVIARRASETEFDLLRMLAPDHPAWRDACHVDDPPASLLIEEVRAALEAGLAPGFAQKVAANALGIALRELAQQTEGDGADRAELYDAIRSGPPDLASDAVMTQLISTTMAKLRVDQPGYPGFCAMIRDGCA